MTHFECPSVSEAVKKRKGKFLEKFLVSRNHILCELFTDKATSQLSLHTYTVSQKVTLFTFAKTWLNIIQFQ